MAAANGLLLTVHVPMQVKNVPVPDAQMLVPRPAVLSDSTNLFQELP